MSNLFIPEYCICSALWYSKYWTIYLLPRITFASILHKSYNQVWVRFCSKSDSTNGKKTFKKKRTIRKEPWRNDGPKFEFARFKKLEYLDNEDPNGETWTIWYSLSIHFNSDQDNACEISRGEEINYLQAGANKKWSKT